MIKELLIVAVVLALFVGVIYLFDHASSGGNTLTGFAVKDATGTNVITGNAVKTQQKTLTDEKEKQLNNSKAPSAGVHLSVSAKIVG